MARHSWSDEGFEGERPGRDVPPVAAAFMACPPAMFQGFGQSLGAAQSLYALAYEQARAQVEGSRLERMRIASWN